MKHLIILLVLKTFFSFGQSEEAIIKDVKKKYEHIQQWLQNDSKLPDIEIYKQCIDPKDENHEDVTPGEIQYYYCNKELRYIIHEYELNVSAKIITKYYLWDNELFFWFQSGEFIDRNFNRDQVLIQMEVFEKRISFFNGQPFQCLGKIYRTSDDSEGNRPYENPFDHLDSLPNKKEDCDTTLNEINDLIYYLELLELSDTELKEECMTRLKSD